jgi:hypothetical protein
MPGFQPKSISMKNTALSVIAAVCLFAIYSCANCRVVECEENGSKRFEFYSSVDSTDLLATGEYSLDDLTITPLLLDDGDDAPTIHKLVMPDSTIEVSVYPNENTAGFVLQLSNMPPDTLLTVTSTSSGSECCNGIIQIDQAILNGDTLPSDSWDRLVKLYK